MTSLQILLALSFTKFRRNRLVWTRSRKYFDGILQIILMSSSEGRVVRTSGASDMSTSLGVLAAEDD